MPRINKITEVNGEKLPKKWLKVLKTIDECSISSPTSDQKRTNPYSGANHNLAPIACTIYDFVVSPFWGQVVGTQIPKEVWNEARYMFLHFWPDEYYDLID